MVKAPTWYLRERRERVTANADLVAIADRYRSKYGWEFSVADGGLIGDGGNAAIVFGAAAQGIRFCQGRRRIADAVALRFRLITHHTNQSRFPAT